MIIAWGDIPLCGMAGWVRVCVFLGGERGLLMYSAKLCECIWLSCWQFLTHLASGPSARNLSSFQYLWMIKRGDTSKCVPRNLCCGSSPPPTPPMRYLEDAGNTSYLTCREKWLQGLIWISSCKTALHFVEMGLLKRFSAPPTTFGKRCISFGLVVKDK